MRVEHDRPAARARDQRAQHEAERPGAEDRHAVAGAAFVDVDRVHRAGERLGQGRERERQAGRQRVEVHARDPLGHEQLLREAAEHVEQVLAQALAPARALAADAARRRVAAEHDVAGRHGAHVLPHGFDRARELVAEPARVRRDRRVPALDGLDVGAAGGGGADPQHDLAAAGDRVGDVLDPEIAGPVQDRRPHGVTITLMPSRRRAVASASAGVLEREAVGDDPVGGDRAGGEQRERRAGVARAGRVRGLDVDLAEEEVVRVERAGLPRPRRREQLDHAAAGDAAQRQLPGLGVARGEDHDVGRLGLLRRAEGLRQRQPLGPRLGDRHVRAAGQRRLDDQQPHLAAADHQQPGARGHARAVQAAHAAGERLDQRRRLVADRVREFEQVARRVRGRDEDQLGESARFDPGLLERLAQRLAPARAVRRRCRTGRGDGRTRGRRAPAGRDLTPRPRPPARGRVRAARAARRTTPSGRCRRSRTRASPPATSPGPGSGAGRSSMRTSPSPR